MLQGQALQRVPLLPCTNRFSPAPHPRSHSVIQSRTCGEASKHAPCVRCKVHRVAVLAVGQPACNHVQIYNMPPLLQGRGREEQGGSEEAAGWK